MKIDLDAFYNIKTSVLLLASRKSSLLKSRQATHSRSKKGDFFFVLVGAFQHHSHAGLLYSYPALNEFRHSTPEAPHTKRRERPLLAKDGTKCK
jgi:hypothetical protein